MHMRQGNFHRLVRNLRKEAEATARNFALLEAARDVLKWSDQSKCALESKRAAQVLSKLEIAVANCTKQTLAEK